MRRILDGQKLIIGESEYQLLPDDNDKELMDVSSGSEEDQQKECIITAPETR